MTGPVLWDLSERGLGRGERRIWEAVRISLAFVVNPAFAPKETGSRAVSKPSQKTSRVS